MKNSKYAGCWYCDNMIDHPEEIGLLYLGFPRCFILIPNFYDFWLQDYDEFMKTAKVNWLDPSHKRTPQEEEFVTILLYNFSVEQERREDELYNENNGYRDDDL